MEFFKEGLKKSFTKGNEEGIADYQAKAEAAVKQLDAAIDIFLEHSSRQAIRIEALEESHRIMTTQLAWFKGVTSPHAEQ